MCHYLTIAVPKKSVESLSSALPDGLRLDPNHNEFFSAALGNVFEFLNLTDGHCSCSLVLTTRPEEGEEVKQIEKYKSKGWSESKIQRALANRRAKPVDESPDLRLTLANMLRSVGPMYIFVHEYSGQFNTEEIASISSLTLRGDELLHEDGEIPEDHIIKLVP